MIFHFSAPLDTPLMDGFGETDKSFRCFCRNFTFEGAFVAIKEDNRFFLHLAWLREKIKIYFVFLDGVGCFFLLFARIYLVLGF